MAKDKKSDAPKDGCTRVRTSIGLPAEWMHVFQHLSTSRSKDLGELVQGFLEREFAGLPRAESEAIRTLVRLSTGKTLRLSGLGGASVAESAPEQPGQGGAGVVDSSGVVPALMARTTSITAMFNRTHAPIDEALHEVGGGN